MASIYCLTAYGHYRQGSTRMRPHYESDLALFTQTNPSRLHTALANFGKHSVRKTSWRNNYREHGLGSTYL